MFNGLRNALLIGWLPFTLICGEQNYNGLNELEKRGMDGDTR